MKFYFKFCGFVLVLFLILQSVSLASSLGLTSLCVTSGQTVKFSLCNPLIVDRTCKTNLCQYCVNEIRTGVYCPLSFSSCNAISDCSFLSDAVNNTDTSSAVTLISPLNNSVNNTTLSSLNLDFNYAATNYALLTSCSLVINDNVIISNQSRLISSTNHISAVLAHGNYTWYVQCVNNTGSSFVSEKRSLAIQSTVENTTTPTNLMNLALINPSSGSSLTTGLIDFSYSVNSSFASNCSFILNNLVNSSILNLTTQTNNFSLVLSPATYNWRIKCNDFNSTEYSSETRTVTINPIPAPVDTSSSGGGGGGGGSVSCSAEWNCTAWSLCKNGTSSRTCKSTKSYCNPSTSKPDENMTCIFANSNLNSNSNTAQNNTSIQNSSIQTVSSSKSSITAAVVGALNGKKILLPIFFMIILAVIFGIFLFRRYIIN